MPTLLVKNADVLVTMDTQRRELKGAGLYAENGVIKQIGQTGELPAIANAIKNATGVRFLHPPFTAAHIYSQLNKRK